jgi:hypothetical protein
MTLALRSIVTAEVITRVPVRIMHFPDTETSITVQCIPNRHSASNYQIFEWAGGCYCRHGWLRRIYFRKSNPDGTFMPNKGLTNETRVGNNPFIVQKGTESIAPYDKPNHGKVNPPFMKS